MLVSWDFDKIWTFCGDTHGVVALCAATERAGLAIPPSPDTARVWKTRKRVPIEWLPTIVRHCITGGMLSASLFVLDETQSDNNGFDDLI